MENIRISDPAVHRLFVILSRLAAKAYSRSCLLANQVLSKNPMCSSLLDYSCGNEKPQKLSFKYKTLKILKYHLKNWGLFLRQILFAMIFRVKGRPCRVAADEALHLADTYFMAANVLRKNVFEDAHFPGLTREFSERELNWAYVPRFYGLNSPWKFLKILHIMRRDRVRALTEFQTLRVRDYLFLALRITVYPVLLIRLAASLGDSQEERLVYQAFWEEFDQNVVAGFVREFHGRRIATFPVSEIRCISWYENQEIDKMFFKGLRNGNVPVTIYGAQLFIWPPTLLNIHPDRAESYHNTLPDVVVVNGKYYLRPGESPEYRLGPSLRYKWLFKDPAFRDSSGPILVLMPYFAYEIRNILELVGRLEGSGFRLKFHPATDVDTFKDILPADCEIASGDLRQALHGSRMVVGAASGGLVEAAALGFPVASVKNTHCFSHNYLPDIGRGDIWEEVEDLVSLKVAVKHFQKLQEEYPEKLEALAREYKEMFFTPPGEVPGGVTLAEAFDLPRSGKQQH